MVIGRLRIESNRTYRRRSATCRGFTTGSGALILPQKSAAGEVLNVGLASGCAPANQLLLGSAGSEDAEAETETCGSGEALVAKADRLSGPPNGLNLKGNRPVRTPVYGGVGGG